jgi:DNA-binding transcriptional ArsR family regulator
MSSDVPRMSITDPRTLRALTHPSRLALLEVLDREGPLTATQAGELIGESPASCSFHLRTLAKYGFVEEAEGGRGRQRPWRRRHVVSEIKEEDLTAEGRIAAQALFDVLHEREQGRLRRWHVTRADYPAEWRAAAGDTQIVLHLTPAELEKLTEELDAALLRYVGRDDPPGAVPVAVYVHAFPLQPPSDPPDEPAPEG